MSHGSWLHKHYSYAKSLLKIKFCFSLKPAFLLVSGTTIHSIYSRSEPPSLFLLPYLPLILESSSLNIAYPFLFLSLPAASAFTHTTAILFGFLLELPNLSFHKNSFHLQPVLYPTKLIILFLCSEPFNNFLFPR